MKGGDNHGNRLHIRSQNNWYPEQEANLDLALTGPFQWAGPLLGKRGPALAPAL